MLTQLPDEESRIPAVAPLRIVMLGPPQVTWEGEPLTIPRRQTRALLYRLAASSEPVPRDQLCFLFWPDVPNTVARSNLSRLLNLLRCALPYPDLLQKQEDTIALDRHRVWSDTEAWMQILETTLPTRDALCRAAALYRGAFLAGFSLPGASEFQNWLTQQRQIWEHRYLDTLAALMDMEISRGAHDKAIAHARRYLEVDELAEEIHRRLIQLYAAVGDRNAALRQFERCAIVLERELGVRPLPETRAAYEAALKGRITALRSRPAPIWDVLPTLEAPFVGREEALNCLQQAYRDAWAGQGRAILVSGEPGIGKSRLLQEFTASLPPETLVLATGGHEAERGLPYWPLAEALRPLLPTTDWPTLGLEPLLLAEVARLLPEIRTHLPDLPSAAPLEPDQEQARLFRALSDLLLGLATHHPPLILCLDDLQWVDHSTLAWLSYWARRIRQAPVLMLGAYRSEEAATVAALQAELARLGMGSPLHLQGLREEEVRYLLGQLAGERIGAEGLSRRLHRETGGNPFFLLEMLRAMFESGLLRRSEKGWQVGKAEMGTEVREWPLPDSIYQVIRTRLARLSPRDRQVLEAGAVLGHRFHLDLLLATSGRSEEEVVEALDILTARQVLSPYNGTYQFAHDLIRTVVYHDLSYGRRRLLHRRAGEALQTLRPDDVIALAYHFEQAQVFDKAIVYLLQAGDRARGLYACQEAIRHYTRALALQREIEDEEGAAHTFMRLGLTHHIAFDFQKAHQAYDQGFALWQRSGLRQPAMVSPPAPHPLRVDWPHLLTLDPALTRSANSGGVIEQLFSGLVESSPSMNIVPEIAHSWEILEGGRKYVFHLRDDVRWSDGMPVTAADFEYAWKRVLDPATGSPCASLLYDLKGARAFHQGDTCDPDRVGVRALDEVTLLVELEGPISYFLHVLAHSVACPVPRHVVEAHGETWTRAGNLVTNGPFRLDAWEWGRRVVLIRNHEYHGRFSGNVQRVELYLLVDSQAKAAKLKMYERDALDIIGLWWGLPPVEMEHVRQRYAGEHISWPQLFTRYVGFDVTRPPFDDRRVRQAFAYAVDRETLANVIMRGFASPATGGFVPPGMPGHSTGIGLKYDPDQARELLSQAGYRRGKGFPTVEWFTFSGSETFTEQLQMEWHRVLGVEIRRETLGWEQYVEKLHSEHPSMFLGGWMADYPDPDNFLRLSDHRDVTQWGNVVYDALVERARRVMDQEERMRMYRRADRMLVEEAPLIPLVYSRRQVLLKPWVRRYPASAFKWWFWKDVVIMPH
jgi:ABC-type oligopeptide transport system substrate-binding subunit/DNA-binding SARP family transcriptional activator